MDSTTVLAEYLAAKKKAGLVMVALVLVGIGAGVTLAIVNMPEDSTIGAQKADVRVVPGNLELITTLEPAKPVPSGLTFRRIRSVRDPNMQLALSGVRRTPSTNALGELPIDRRWDNPVVTLPAPMAVDPSEAAIEFVEEEEPVVEERTPTESEGFTVGSLEQLEGMTNQVPVSMHGDWNLALSRMKRAEAGFTRWRTERRADAKNKALQDARDEYTFARNAVQRLEGQLEPGTSNRALQAAIQWANRRIFDAGKSMTSGGK